MRMGILSKHERIGKAYPQQKPKFSSLGLIVGQVSSNVINSILTPLMEELATSSLETYASQYVAYQDLLKEVAASNTQKAEVDVDGNIHSATDPPEPPKPPLFHSQAVIDEVKELFTETAKDFSVFKKYRVYAKAAKFERLLDERYGVFRPFITNHPQIEHYVRSIQRRYELGHFSPIRQTQGPISKSTAIIFLFMMQRNGVHWNLMVLAVLFLLVGLQPWALVVSIAIVKWLVGKRKTRALGNMKKEIDALEPYYKKEGDGSDNFKQSLLKQMVGTKFSNDINMSDYNTMILGSGPGALYTAALLAKAGRKVLVLSPDDDASGCTTIDKYPSMPFDIQNNNISRIRRQQEILAPALCTTTDYQGGIRFAQIGNQTDGHAFEILSIPGMGGDNVPFVLRADGGTSGFMDDTARFLGDGWPDYDGGIGNNLAGAYLAACQSMNATASEYYMSKVLTDKVNDLRSKSTYSEVSIRYTAPFLDQTFPMNAHLRALMAGIGMKDEDLKPSKASMGAHVTNVCAAMSGEGLHYPIGGPRALCHALTSVVEQCGGKVATGAPLAQLVFDESVTLTNDTGEKHTEERVHPRCIGVKLEDGQVLVFPTVETNADNCVVSFKSFIDTFIRLLPEHIRDEFKVPRGLPALSERRPHIKVLFALQGSAEDLDVTGADFYRVPSASLPIDELDPVTGTGDLGQVGGCDKLEADQKEEGQITLEDINCLSAESTAISAPRKKPRRHKFDTGVSWMHIAFPSAKDPTFASRHGDMTTCVVTIEADDDFVVLFDTKPKIYSMLRTSLTSEAAGRLLERVKNDLIDTFPQLADKIDHVELRGPFVQGLSHNPERYAAKGIRVDTPYPGLYMGSPDLTVGDSFSGSIVAGWLAANAVVGYSAVDYLFLEKNVTSDLEQFMVLPNLSDEQCLAVPYFPPLSTELEVTSDANEKEE